MKEGLIPQIHTDTHSVPPECLLAIPARFYQHATKHQRYITEKIGDLQNECKQEEWERDFYKDQEYADELAPKAPPHYSGNGRRLFLLAAEQGQGKTNLLKSIPAGSTGLDLLCRTNLGRDHIRMAPQLGMELYLDGKGVKSNSALNAPLWLAITINSLGALADGTHIRAKRREYVNIDEWDLFESHRRQNHPSLTNNHEKIQALFRLYITNADTVILSTADWKPHHYRWLDRWLLENDPQRAVHCFRWFYPTRAGRTLEMCYSKEQAWKEVITHAMNGEGPILVGTEWSGKLPKITQNIDAFNEILTREGKNTVDARFINGDNSSREYPTLLGLNEEKPLTPYSVVITNTVILGLNIEDVFTTFALIVANKKPILGATALNQMLGRCRNKARLICYVKDLFFDPQLLELNENIEQYNGFKLVENFNSDTGAIEEKDSLFLQTVKEQEEINIRDRYGRRKKIIEKFEGLGGDVAWIPERLDYGLASLFKPDKKVEQTVREIEKADYLTPAQLKLSTDELAMRKTELMNRWGITVWKAIHTERYDDHHYLDNARRLQNATRTPQQRLKTDLLPGRRHDIQPLLWLGKAQDKVFILLSEDERNREREKRRDKRIMDIKALMNGDVDEVIIYEHQLNDKAIFGWLADNRASLNGHADFARFPIERNGDCLRWVQKFLTAHDLYVERIVPSSNNEIIKRYVLDLKKERDYEYRYLNDNHHQMRKTYFRDLILEVPQDEWTEIERQYIDLYSEKLRVRKYDFCS